MNDFFIFSSDPQTPKREATVNCVNENANMVVEINGVYYEVIKSSDVIESEGKTGKTFWQGHVVCDGNGSYYTATSYWQETKDGISVVQWSTPYYAEPKNIGKSNETTNETQAYAEFESMVKKERRVRESNRPLPMLAQTFEKRKKYIEYPCAIQPKLDGMRMLTNGVEAWSRKNKLMDPKIIEHIVRDLEGLGDRILDGELALPWFPKVNITMSAAKRYQEDLTPKLKYFVYDIVDPDVDFNTRYRILEDWVMDRRRDNVVLVETKICANEKEVMYWHKYWTDAGFEGSIIRNLGALYEIDKRSNHLQKHKDFVDEEFEIVDIIPAGGGSSAEVGKFVCRANNGQLFESTATGSEDERRDYLINKHKYIGKFAVVKYRELTGPNGVPFHSNVLQIRETKDRGY